MKLTRESVIDFLRRNSVLFKFYGLFAYFMLLFFFFSHWQVTKHYLEETYPAFIAQVVGWLLNLINVKTSVYGADVRLPGFAFKIILHCAGVFVMIIYSSAVLAYPATWMEKFLGLLMGLPALFAINTIRLVVLGLVGMHYPSLFEYFHEYLWQGIFIVFVIVLWMFWKALLVRSEIEVPAVVSG